MTSSVSLQNRALASVSFLKKKMEQIYDTRAFSNSRRLFGLGAAAYKQDVKNCAKKRQSGNHRKPDHFGPCTGKTPFWQIHDSPESRNYGNDDYTY
jgi:hypothetical protein